MEYYILYMYIYIYVYVNPRSAMNLTELNTIHIFVIWMICRPDYRVCKHRDDTCISTNSLPPRHQFNAIYDVNGIPLVTTVNACLNHPVNSFIISKYNQSHDLLVFLQYHKLCVSTYYREIKTTTFLETPITYSPIMCHAYALPILITKPTYIKPVSLICPISI
jgi:hypothetical protein